MNSTRFSPYEWVLSNRMGGYALGPANLLNHRKYHGLLVAATQDVGRIHLVSSIEEEVGLEGESTFFLDSNNYPNVVYPQGYRHLLKYFLRPYPSFLCSTVPFSYETLILKSIQLHPKLNFSVVRYRNIGKIPFKLTLRPKFTLRSHHAVHKPGYWDSGEYFCELQQNIGKVSADGHDAFLHGTWSRMEIESNIYRNVTYPTEIVRGYDGVEDLLAPFRVVMDLGPGDEGFLVFGDRMESDFERIASEAFERYDMCPLPSNHPLRSERTDERVLSSFTSRGEKAFGYREYLDTLELSFLEFICDDDLIAGFPWFSSWGRDTMISLEALKYIDEGAAIAGRILKKYGKNLKDGLIPNTLGERDADRNYEAVDASLWFGLRILEFWESFGPDDKSIMLGYLYEVIANYLLNESLPFHTDSGDGLIDIRRRGDCALTWMDAKVHGYPVTPRYGKPIEVNGLWFALLRMFTRMAAKEGIEGFFGYGRRVSTARLKALAAKARKSLGGFFYGNGFADRVEDGVLVKEIRPNYLITLSLPVEIFKKDQIKIGYDIAREKLLTDCGMRSLSPGSRAFRKKYMGNQTMRDLAYHQGSVWVWLLLPMAKVAEKVFRGDRVRLKRELQGFVSVFRDGFTRGEMASIPELYDGESSLFPKGAPAQCWSVAAVLIMEKMTERLRGVL